MVSGGIVVEWWLIEGVGFFEVLLGNRRSDEPFCPSTLRYTTTRKATPLTHLILGAVLSKVTSG